jgi:pimeloyl-ACP methyl ester carboxylesterase
MTVQDKTITLSGLQVHHFEAGEEQGRALLLLHGMGGAHLSWAPAIPTLAEHYHVIAPDLPGFGSSTPLPNQRTHALIHWIKTLLDSLKLQQAVVVGNSIGGLIARLYASAEPQYVPAVILVNGGAVPTMPAPLRAAANTPGLGNVIFGLLGRTATSRSSIDQMIHAPSVKTEAYIRQVIDTRQGFSALLRMLARDSLPAATPRVPTLLLWGAEDKVVTLDEAEKIKASIPGSILSPIAECGHMPQLEATEVFTWQVHQFLENLSRPQKPESRGAGMLSQK